EGQNRAPSTDRGGPASARALDPQPLRPVGEPACPACHDPHLGSKTHSGRAAGGPPAPKTTKQPGAAPGKSSKPLSIARGGAEGDMHIVSILIAASAAVAP